MLVGVFYYNGEGDDIGLIWWITIAGVHLVLVGVQVSLTFVGLFT